MPEPTDELRDVRARQADGADWAIASQWSGATRLWEHLRDNTNFVRAAELIEWPLLMPDGAVVLDLGCGAGWLSALLSREPRAGRVLAWDSSPSLLRDVVPEVIDLIGGHADKIERVCGYFEPLALDDDEVDLVVMSSAFHHSAEPMRLLSELRRVLRPGGVAVLLNETPWHPLGLAGFATRLYASAIGGLVGAGAPMRGQIGARHVLYDELLGDRAYSLREWRRMFRSAGFTHEICRSGLSSYPPHQRPRGRLEPDLTHFVLRDAAGRSAG